MTSVADQNWPTSSGEAPSYAESTPACPITGSHPSRLLCEVDGYRIWRCPGSATDFVWPVPDEKSLKRLYDREQWFEGGEKGGYQDYDQQTDGLLPFFDGMLSEFEQQCPGRSILDVGCGYGSHLARAAARGWKCFGVEISEHAREVVKARHGNNLFVVSGVEKLIPHEFDVILLFDVIEHLRDPYHLFYRLFSKGAISPRTRMAITTPNARSCEAVRDPGRWTYRHPPSHLVYYSARSLEILLKKLRFREVCVTGIHPLASAQPASYPDEHFPENDVLASYAGLLCVTQGSDFHDFMHERYVPGTWSKLAEYEHVPRYAFAKTLVSGARVLDFGCGTGYGAALLAEAAKEVVAVDIDEGALRWARETHANSRLHFEKRSDLGAGLPDGSFDCITCFETIEHVDQKTQIECVRNFARLLTVRGILIISTPNPEVTANYGENPFHLREMTEHEFRMLLKPHFRHVVMFRQWIHPSVAIQQDFSPRQAPPLYHNLPEARQAAVPPLAYIAVCSNQPFTEAPGLYLVDSSFDYIARATAAENNFHEAQLENYSRQELLNGLQRHADSLQHQVATRDREIAAFKATKLYRLTDAFRERLSLHKIVRILYLLIAMLTPSPIRRRLRPHVVRLKARLAPRPVPQSRPRLSNVTPRPLRPQSSPARQPIERVTVVIPTKNAGPLFGQVLEGIRAQEFAGSLELLVLDSGSTDGTVGLAREAGARVVAIEPQSFNHGMTRNRGIELATGEVVVLITQDAVPGDRQLIQHLVAAFDDPEVAGSYARQVPRSDSDVLTQRNLNRWVTGAREPAVRSIEELASYDALDSMVRYQFCNFDNVCSAVRRSIWKELPFAVADFGEDIRWGKTALEHGWKIAYEPRAWVVHSHNRSLAHDYRRTYSCHKTLFELFDLQTVPTLAHLFFSVAASISADWRYVLRYEWRVGTRIALLAEIPFRNLVITYAQYRGARDARLQRERDEMSQ